MVGSHAAPRMGLALGLLVFVLGSGTAKGQVGSDIQGIWQGTLVTPGGELRVVFHVRSPQGGFTATMDSPDQGATGIPTSDVTFEASRLRIEVPAVQGRYEGVLSSDQTTFDGTWSQGLARLPLVLERVDEITGPNRPQDPAEPYPYRSENVAFANREAGVTLAGTLTCPQGEAPFAAAVLISGSGRQDRNETVMGHRPFLVLADHLTRSGIAVLRYDDRGVASSTGDFGTATSEDFALDALAAVHFLQSRPEIDARRIGLIGHSEGGLIAPMVAAASEEVAFVILLAGPGIKGEDILYLQSELIGRAEGMPESVISRNQEFQRRIFSRVKSSDDPQRVKEDVRAIVAEALRSAAAEGQQGAEPTDPAIDARVANVTSPWFRFFLTHDPAAVLERVHVPVLALIGELDLQVPPEQNLPGIADALRRAGNTDFDTVELPGLNHLLQTAETGSPSEYGRINETMSPVALRTISDWILARF